MPIFTTHLTLSGLMCYHNLMVERNERRIPDWAERERAGDLGWIRENLSVLWPAAQVGYATVGRGAIIVDTKVQIPGAGHPFGYLDQAAIGQEGDQDTQRMVRDYDPTGEMVTALLKTQDRISSYRVRVIPGETREDLGARVKPS